MNNKIYFFITDITTAGGTERALTTLANELVNIHYNITIFSLYRKNEFISFPLDKRVNVHYLKNKNKFFKLLEIKDICKKKANAIKIVVSMGRLSVEISTLFRIFNLKNLILTEHTSFSSYSYLIKKLKIISYKAAREVIVLTNYDKDLLNKKYNLNNISVIENINPYDKYYYNSEYKDRDNIAIAIGRFCYAKNFQRLLNIWSQAETKNWSLLIIGEGNDKRDLEELIFKLKLNNVIILPFQKNIHEFYKKAKLYLMTSRFEGLPMVLIESQYFGIPSISFDCKTGPAEIIEDNINGYLIKYESDIDYINKLNLFISDADIQNTFSKNTSKNKIKYSTNTVIKKWEKILSKKI
ncbi:glycosyltransferase family 4 protein [Providencia stuartii]